MTILITPKYMLRAFAVTTLVSSLAFATAVQAQTSDASDNDQQSTSDQSSTTTMATKKSIVANHDQRVEGRIASLHKQLSITSAQEDQWKQVAQAMRDNEDSIGKLIAARKTNGATMTAVDDLQSYQDITQAHVDGLKKLIPVFQELYNGMSDAQKKNADTVFGSFEGRGHGKKK